MDDHRTLVDATAVVLTGGKSSRMGRPKALLPFNNEPLLVHILRALKSMFAEAVVVAAPDQELPPLAATVVELWGLHVFEESLSQWSGEWYKALTTHYGFTKQDAVYFSTHEEADMDTHKLGQGGEEAMGHGAFNRTVLARALQERVEYRAGYSMEYCALTMVDLHAQMKQAALDNPYSP
jgi:hypothetical protein